MQIIIIFLIFITIICLSAVIHFLCEKVVIGSGEDQINWKLGEKGKQYYFGDKAMISRMKIKNAPKEFIDRADEYFKEKKDIDLVNKIINGMSVDPVILVEDNGIIVEEGLHALVAAFIINSNIRYCLKKMNNSRLKQKKESV